MKVHYFSGYGRAEAIRMLLAHAKVEFEDVHYTFETLPALKETGNLEFGQVPAVEIDGKWYAQSTSILRMLGKKYGYYPDDAFEAWRVDSTIDALGDLLNAYYKAAFAPTEELKKS
jgi:glutathione S-transferase